jgi:hypothetical protein
MGRLALAWRVLTSGDFAARINGLLNAPPAIAVAPEAVVKPAAVPPKPVRSDAISLLSALQREGRLIDGSEKGSGTNSQMARRVLRTIGS